YDCERVSDISCPTFGSDAQGDRLQKRSNGRFANPAERKGCDCDSKLRRRDEQCGIASQTQRGPGAPASGRGPSFETRAPHRNQGELGAYKEAIGSDKEKYAQELARDFD